MKTKYESQWQQVIAEVEIKCLFKNSFCEVYIACVSKEDKQFVYAIKILDKSLEIDLPLFNLENLLITQGQNDRILLILRNEALFDVFIGLTFDLHINLQKAVSSNEIIPVISGVISKFLHLFKKKRGNDIAKIIGLYGELLFIKRGIDQGIDMISKWYGSDGNRHDFSCRDASFEIKSGYRKKGIVSISSELQLMVKPPEYLFLVNYFFDVKLGEEDSVYKLINSIKEQIDVEKYIQFIKKLCDLDVEFDAYWRLPESFKIELLAENYYSVDENFPKLTSDNIPNGVNKVKYDIQLSSINDSCKKEEADLWRHLN